MTLPVPRLDDRRYAQLVDEAVKRVRETCPEWTDLGPGDPGLTLIEVFAFITENMIYRLNRVPEKLYVTLLNLVGAQVRPPSAAAVTLTFSRMGANGGDIQIPMGAQVSSSDGSVAFTVTQAVTLKAKAASVDAPALNAELVAAEPASLGPGRSFRVRRPPVIAPTGDGLDLIVGVEATEEELGGAPSRSVDGKAFALWSPAASYAEAVNEPQRVLVDRAAGLITFPPGAAPITGRDIRVWYRRGGGRAGNVGVASLTAVKTPGLSLNVTNAQAAAGGEDVETLQSAIARTPIEAAAARGAVTARDFERAALIGGVARARAFALAQQWRHADPGVVQLLLAPTVEVDSMPERAVTRDAFVARQAESLRQRVATLVDERRPLGVRVSADWVKVRPVSATARVVVTRGEDPDAMARAIRQRLNDLFSPFNAQPFGRVLRASDAYEAILADPAVRYVDQLSFAVADTPASNVENIVSDPHQPRTWFAAADDALHRSLDDGDSWSSVYQAASEKPVLVRRHPDRPGLVALVVAQTGGSAIHLSSDCGETWSTAEVVFNYEITDAAWTDRDRKPLLLIATRQGLMQFEPGPAAGPSPVSVDASLDAKGFYAVTAATSSSGAVTVAVATRETSGVYVSAGGGVSGSFKQTGLNGKDIRRLVVQRFNGRGFLWAAAEAEAGQAGEGAFRLELAPNGEAAGDWRDFNIGWQGGACEGLTFIDGLAVAGSNHGGVLTMDTGAEQPGWTVVGTDGGLPPGNPNGVIEVTTVAAAATATKPIVFAGGPAGVFRSIDGGARFSLASATSSVDRIPLPPNWLYCAAPHDIAVVQEGEG